MSDFKDINDEIHGIDNVPAPDYGTKKITISKADYDAAIARARKDALNDAAVVAASFAERPRASDPVMGVCSRMQSIFKAMADGVIK